MGECYVGWFEIETEGAEAIGVGGVDGDVVGGIRGRGCRDGEAGWKGDTSWFQAETPLVYGVRRKEDYY